MSLIYNADALKLLQANAKRHDDITQFKYDKYPRMHHLDDVVEKIYEELTALDAASGGGGTQALVGTYTNEYIPRWNSTSNTLESGSIQDNGTSIGIGVSANSGITCNIVATGDSQLSVLRVQGITSPNKTGAYTIHNNYIMFSGATAKVTGVLSANINQIYIMDGLTLPSEAIGSNNKVFHYDTVNDLAKAVGVSSYINSSPGADIVEGIAYEIKQPSSYGNITTWYGLKSEGSDNDNTNYHIYLAAHQDGAAKWGIYQAGANDKNYFAGAMQFDTAAAAVGYVWKATDVDGNGDWATITKTDVGLGNVENTALSTWSGSTNITTLGTIATGTWQGTAITGTYIDESTVDHDQLLNFNANEHFTQASITTVGTVGTGVWQGTAIADSYIASAATWNAKANITGTPANNQIAVWTNGTTIEGVSTFTYDSGTTSFKVSSPSDDDYSEFTNNGITQVRSTDDANLSLICYGDQSKAAEIQSFKYRNTLSSPQALLSGDLMASHRHIGWDGSAINTSLYTKTFAAENWTGSAAGVYHVIDTCAIGETTATERFRIDSDGAIKFNNAYKFPTADGSANQILKTNGSGTLTFQSDNSVTATSGAAQRLAVFDGTNSVEGDANLTYTGSTVIVASSSNANTSNITSTYFQSKVETNDANCLLYGYGTSNSGELVLASARGTIGSSTAVQSGDTLGEIQGFGHTGTGFRLGGQFLFKAGENYVETSNYGSTFALRLVPNGSTTLATRYTIDGDGTHSFVGDVKYSQQVYQDGGIYNAGSTGASFTPNFINGNLQKITMSNASITINNPTNVQDGATYTICFVQDATGGRTIATWGSNWNWGDAGAPDFSGGTASGDKFYVTIIVNGTELDAIYSGVKH